LVASSVSCARASTSAAVRAWRGAVTPPIVTVTAMAPESVGTNSSRTPANSRSAATAMSSGVKSFRTTPNLLPE